MRSLPPEPSRDLRDAWQLIQKWLSRCPELSSRAGARVRDGIHGYAETVWILAALVCLCAVVIGELKQPTGAKHLLNLSFIAVIFLAFRYVLLRASSADELRIRRLIKNAPELGAFVVVIVGAYELHLMWQGRLLGYLFSLLASARFAPTVRRMSMHAPESLTARIKWYLSLWALGMLAITMFAQAWSLTIPIRFRGDLPHPPVNGLLIVGVWLPCLLTVVLVGSPTAKRLLAGGLRSVDANGRRRFFISHLFGSLVLSTGAGALVLNPFGHPMLGSALGLIASLVTSGVWEVLVRSNVLLRGPGPLIWGFGLFFMAAGVRGAIVGSSQLHPVSAELGAAMLIWLGFWIERRVVREVCGMTRRTSVDSGPEAV